MDGRRRHSTRNRRENLQAEGSSALVLSPKPRARGTRGKLAVLLDMPLDVLLEISTHIGPLDIQHLARSSRIFRKILMSKQSRHIWRVVIKNARYPECPENMSEPFYVALLCDPGLCGCLRCGSRTKNTPNFSVRGRVCQLCHLYVFCYGDYILKTVRAEYNIPDGTTADNVLLTMVPFYVDEPWLPREEESIDRLLHRRFPRETFKEIASQYYGLLSNGAGQDIIDAFVKEQQAAARKALLHANDIHNRREEDELQRRDTKEAFSDAVGARLMQLGYTATQLRETESHFRSEWRPHTSKARELTERVWKNIRPKLEGILRQNEERNGRRVRIILLLEDKIRAYEAEHGIHVWTYTPIEQGGLEVDLSSVKSFIITHGMNARFNEGAIEDNDWFDLLENFNLRSELNKRWWRLKLR